MAASTVATGFPLPNPTKSYWQTPPLPISDHRTTTDLPASAKYIIVGSGITGASIAYKLLQEEPSASIVLLEARQAASGASGRNGGHCRGGRYLSFKDDIKQFGIEDALRLDNLEESNVRNVTAFIQEHDIDCDLRSVETCDIFVDQKQWDHAIAALKSRKEISGETERGIFTDHKIWSQKEARDELLVPKAIGAISFPAFVLSPYKFVCALLEMSIKKGMNLQTNTTVLDVSQAQKDGSKKWTVRTERGDIQAGMVILATNAYTAALYPPLSDFIIPTRAQIAAVRPGSKIAGNPVFKRTCALYTASGSPYFQSRADDVSGSGDLIFGGGRSKGTNNEQPVFDDTTIHPDVSKYLTNAALTFFGEETWGEKGEVLQEWTGIMGYTADKVPLVGEAPGQKGLWICAGFHGHGMALTFQSAEALVGLLMGREKAVEEWLPACYKLSRVPIKK